MSVTMMTSSFWPGYEGGAERQSRKLLDELRRRGETCAVVTMRTEWRLPRSQEIDGVRVLRLGRLAPLEHIVRKGWSRFEGVLCRWSLMRGPRVKPLVEAVGFWLCCPLVFMARFSFITAIGRAFRGGLFDAGVIHVHESSWIAGVGVRAGQQCGVPVCCKEASHPVLMPIGFDTPMRKSLDRLRRSAFFVAQTDAAASALIEEGIARERIEVIPNGVELPDLATRKVVTDDVLYVGNFSQGAHWKAFDVLFEAWADVSSQEPEARLRMVGGGDASAWQVRAEQLGCAESVDFVGRSDSPDVFYARAALLVLPSRVEGMSNVLLEAMAWGIPVVVSDIPGNTAVVTHDATGLVVSVGDDKALAGAIVRLLRDGALRDRLGANARRCVEQAYGISNVMDRYQALYERLRGDDECEL